MRLFDFSFSKPEENLACDEALLEAAERGHLPDTLRFWESKHYFVVMGYGGKTQQETRLKQCQKDNIPVLRRASGGGTVLQGPGCLNYSLVLGIEGRTELMNITQAGDYIMKQHKLSLGNLLGAKFEIQGHTDLTWKDLKFSGNAQRRRKKAILFHGTLLYDFNINRIETYLPLPPKQPDYRAQRKHDDFLTNIKADSGALKKCLQEAWQAKEVLRDPPHEIMQELLESRYLKTDWHQKY